MPVGYYQEFLACLHAFADSEYTEARFDELMLKFFAFKDLPSFKQQAVDDGLLSVSAARNMVVVEVASSDAITRVSKEPPF